MEELRAGYVSIDDLVSTFTYVTITLTRQSIHQWDNSQEVVMSKPVDPVPALGINASYQESMPDCVCMKFTAQELKGLLLFKVAQSLR